MISQMAMAAAQEIARLRAWAKDEQRGRHKAEEDRMNARGEIERLRAALRPFAQIADKFEHDGVPPTIAMLDCRHAQDVLADRHNALGGAEQSQPQEKQSIADAVCFGWRK